MRTFKSWLKEEFLLEKLLGSVNGAEGYKAASHFKAYVAPFLKKDEISKGKKGLEHISKMNDLNHEKDGEYSGNEHSHTLITKHGPHPVGTKIKVTGLSHVDENGRIHLKTIDHGVVPQSRLKKPEHLARENKTETGFTIEKRISANLGTKSAGSTGSAYDFHYGKNKDSSHTVKGKVETVSEEKALKKDNKPVVAGESKLTVVKMGASGVKYNNETKKWSFIGKKLPDFTKHLEEHASHILQHLNENHSDGKIEKGFTVAAPKGTAKSYFKSIGANALHVHDKETDSGTSFTIGNKNELKGKTKLGHLSDKDIEEHLNGRINVEKAPSGIASVFHRPLKKKMVHLASLSTSDPHNHRDLTNVQHAGEFKRHIDNHIRETSKKLL